MTPLRIIFCGSGEFGLPALGALLATGHEIVRVYTQPDRPAGRGMKLSPTPVARFAEARGLPFTPTADLNAEPLPPADLMVVIAFGQKVAERVVGHARLGAINLHASRLPKYRGAAPINAAILAGETVTGNSVIRLAQKMDAGAVLAQSELPIGPLETAGELHDRLSADGAVLIPRVAADLAAGTAIETEQDHASATLARKLSRESARIEFHGSARQAARQVRGLYPWPGCRVRLLVDEDEVARMTLVRATFDDRAGDEPAKAGLIDDRGYVIFDVGRLVVVEVQPDGGRSMSLDAFRNGRPWRAGMRLESIA
jgi:methionyl-tRNA formyltransferase